jgi:hypothetical protein
MNEQATSWHPSHDEVEHILEELRPIIWRQALRDEISMAWFESRREHASV